LPRIYKYTFDAYDMMIARKCGWSCCKCMDRVDSTGEPQGKNLAGSDGLVQSQSIKLPLRALTKTFLACYVMLTIALNLLLIELLVNHLVTKRASRRKQLFRKSR